MAVQAGAKKNRQREQTGYRMGRDNPARIIPCAGH